MKKRSNTGAILIALICSCLFVSSADARTHSYFVGAWVFDKDTCYGSAEPKMTGDWERDLWALIKATKFKFFSNGQVVVEIAGKVAERGRWSFSGNSLRLDLGGGPVDVYEVLSTKPNKVVALESGRDEPFTWLRCK